MASHAVAKRPFSWFREIVRRPRRACAAWLLLGLLCGADPAAGQPAGLIPASDIPPGFTPVVSPVDFDLRQVDLPMRDGVRLRTVIVMPKGTTAAPLLVNRTPYGVERALKPNARSMEELLSGLNEELVRAGYILVLQDIRGRHASGGDYRFLRPLAGSPLNRTAVDESTDAWDTIDWLVKNVPESTGRVGVFGGSYGGFTTLMAGLDPHPALKALVPSNAVVDVWTGDDLFHRGAFRQTYLDWLYSLVSEKGSKLPWPEPRHDAYETWLQAGSAGAAASAQGMDSLPLWRRIVEHPAYDSYWRDQAVDRLIAGRTWRVPTLHVHSQWDQEDIYGPIAAYTAAEAQDPENNVNFLVIGPWRHGGGAGDGSEIGPIRFETDTALEFRREILIPFLDRFLKETRSPAPIAPVSVFETGGNIWRRYDRWPVSCASGCSARSRHLYLTSAHGLSFTPPTTGAAFDEYVSDPSKPVTYRPRPIRPTYAPDSTWSRWLVDDQRFAADRPDVLVYTTAPLTAPVRIAGQPIVHLVASTSGQDADWVVKLIDVYPDVVANQPEMGGYQLPIAMDILRGRYRDDPSRPTPIPSDTPTGFTLPLPHADHVFLPGHRIMVQVQSSWFPLYDRNPQQWVDNIFLAVPSDYARATHRVFHTPGWSSSIELPIVP